MASINSGISALPSAAIAAAPAAKPSSPAPAPGSNRGSAPTWRLPGPAALLLIAGLFAIILPTLVYVAQEAWSTEQNAHGPIVLLTGLWLLARLWPSAAPLAARPPVGRVIALFAILLPVFFICRVTQIVELEGYLMYALVLATGYAFVGAAALRRMWFPLFYLAFMFPPPETIVYAATLPMKVGVSEVAVWLLALFNYPVASTGVSIQIGQYQLLVAAACSGLNSIISLSALSTFYIYMRHKAHPVYAMMLVTLVVPVALIANFVRVMILILLTYHSGEAVAQGFLHNFAGLTMFAVALLAMFGLDSLIEPIWRRFVPDHSRPTTAAPAIAAAGSNAP